MKKKGSKYNRFTFNYTQQLGNYLSNKEDVAAGKKLLSIQVPDKPWISRFLSQTFNMKFNYSNIQTLVAKPQLPPTDSKVFGYTGGCRAFATVLAFTTMAKR